MNEIYQLLRTLGLSSTYRGYDYLAYAVYLCQKDRNYLLTITKWLHPEIARRFDTNAKCVERNMRTLITAYWQTGRGKLLGRLAGYRLVQQPTTGEFIAILSDYLLSRQEMRSAEIPGSCPPQTIVL